MERGASQVRPVGRMQLEEMAVFDGVLHARGNGRDHPHGVLIDARRRRMDQDPDGQLPLVPDRMLIPVRLCDGICVRGELPGWLPAHHHSVPLSCDEAVILGAHELQYVGDEDRLAVDAVSPGTRGAFAL